MSNRSIIIVILLAVAAFLVTQTFYTVDPTKQVLVRQFGAIVGEHTYNVDAYDRLQSYYVKAAAYAGDRFRFGRDYDRTLIAWDNAFTHNWSSIEPLGFDRRFYRMWRLYLHYCAVGFRFGRIDVVQFRLDKPA